MVGVRKCGGGVRKCVGVWREGWEVCWGVRRTGEIIGGK